MIFLSSFIPNNQMNKHINNTGITINVAKDLKDKSLKYKNFINSGTGIVKKVTIIIGKSTFFIYRQTLKPICLMQK